MKKQNQDEILKKFTNFFFTKLETRIFFKKNV
jgi:hypothetical protein